MTSNDFVRRRSDELPIDFSREIRDPRIRCYLSDADCKDVSWFVDNIRRTNFRDWAVNSSRVLSETNAVKFRSEMIGWGSLFSLEYSIKSLVRWGLRSVSLIDSNEGIRSIAVKKHKSFYTTEMQHLKQLLVAYERVKLRVGKLTFVFLPPKFCRDPAFVNLWQKIQTEFSKSDFKTLDLSSPLCSDNLFALNWQGGGHFTQDGYELMFNILKNDFLSQHTSTDDGR